MKTGYPRINSAVLPAAVRQNGRRHITVCIQLSLMNPSAKKVQQYNLFPVNFVAYSPFRSHLPYIPNCEGRLFSFLRFLSVASFYLSLYRNTIILIPRSCRLWLPGIREALLSSDSSDYFTSCAEESPYEIEILPYLQDSAPPADRKKAEVICSVASAIAIPGFAERLFRSAP